MTVFWIALWFSGVGLGILWATAVIGLVREIARDLTPKTHWPDFRLRRDVGDALTGFGFLLLILGVPVVVAVMVAVRAFG